MASTLSDAIFKRNYYFWATILSQNGYGYGVWHWTRKHKEKQTHETQI